MYDVTWVRSRDWHNVESDDKRDRWDGYQLVHGEQFRNAHHKYVRGSYLHKLFNAGVSGRMWRCRYLYP